MSMDMLQFNKICRTCLIEGDHRSFLEIAYEEKSSSEIFNMCTTLQIEMEDNLPQNVCDSCVMEILQIYAFFKKCQESEAVLRYIVNLQPNVITECKNEDADIDFMNTYMPVDVVNDDCDNANDDCDNANNKSDISNDVDLPKNITVQKRKTVHTNTNNFTKTLRSRFTCNICREEFKEYKLFVQHRRDAKHPVVRTRIACSLCSKEFTTKTFHRHMITHTKEKPYKCKVCLMAFNVPGNLKRHIKIHTGERPYICEFCGKGFIQLASLHVHRNTHTISSSEKKGKFNGDKNKLAFSCKYCGRLFKRLASYNAHVKKHDSITGELKSFVESYENDPTEEIYHYSCSVCGRAFKTKVYLKTHERRCHGEKSYLCNYCGKGFALKTSLQSHRRVHTGEKPYSCIICKKNFAHLANFESHMLIHTGTKPHQCSVCARTFTQKSHLKYHSLTHSGEKSYACDYCDKTFALKGNLTVHVRTHTGETPYVCCVCGKGYHDSSSMKKHRMGHVGAEQPLVTEKQSDHTDTVYAAYLMGTYNP